MHPRFRRITRRPITRRPDDRPVRIHLRVAATLAGALALAGCSAPIAGTPTAGDEIHRAPDVCVQALRDADNVMVLLSAREVMRGRDTAEARAQVATLTDKLAAALDRYASNRDACRVRS